MAYCELTAIPSGEKAFVVVKDYGIKPREVVSLLKPKPEVVSKMDIGKATDLFS